MIRRLVGVVATLVILSTVFIVPVMASSHQTPGPNQVAFWCEDGGKKFEPGGLTWVADADYPLVVVKGGNVDTGNGPGNNVYFDVQAGDVLQAPLNAGGQHAAISHVITCFFPPTPTTTVPGQCDETPVVIEPGRTYTVDVPAGVVTLTFTNDSSSRSFGTGQVGPYGSVTFPAELGSSTTKTFEHDGGPIVISANADSKFSGCLSVDVEVVPTTTTVPEDTTTTTVPEDTTTTTVPEDTTTTTVPEDTTTTTRVPPTVPTVPPTVPPPTVPPTAPPTVPPTSPSIPPNDVFVCVPDGKGGYVWDSGPNRGESCLPPVVPVPDVPDGEIAVNCLTLSVTVWGVDNEFRLVAEGPETAEIVGSHDGTFSLDVQPGIWVGVLTIDGRTVDTETFATVECPLPHTGLNLFEFTGIGLGLLGAGVALEALNRRRQRKLLVG